MADLRARERRNVIVFDVLDTHERCLTSCEAVASAFSQLAHARHGLGITRSISALDVREYFQATYVVGADGKLEKRPSAAKEGERDDDPLAPLAVEDPCVLFGGMVQPKVRQTARAFHEGKFSFVLFSSPRWWRRKRGWKTDAERLVAVSQALQASSEVRKTMEARAQLQSCMDALEDAQAAEEKVEPKPKTDT
eukprot:scaffold257_cov241-Pinguiococcus_pyrenoidosus.AAC.10